MIKLLMVGKDKAQTKARAREIVEEFRAEFDGREDIRAEIMGPAMIACWKGEYRFVLLIKTNNLDRVRGFLRVHGLHQRDEVTIDIDPIMIL